ncbi:hypothetical protein FJU31_05275 [Stenotrophomonas cyclobalanopsidis]|uniref:Uncharacterized protein n=1 Tax=Stenotrophomonas cyclobalanopsidis TaxID=2771362 RepID=A0ABQ6T444_9GAMM|nr:hypothetical protein FJU31_05275 [Stenotrophomonas cyclobalanopsidis]
MTGIGTGAGTGARWGSGGPAVGGLSGPVFLGGLPGEVPSTHGVDPDEPKTNGPALRGRLLSEVPTSDRAGTGGIQMFLSDIDVELFGTAP